MIVDEKKTAVDAELCSRIIAYVSLTFHSSYQTITSNKSRLHIISSIYSYRHLILPRNRENVMKLEWQVLKIDTSSCNVWLLRIILAPRLDYKSATLSSRKYIAFNGNIVSEAPWKIQFIY